VKAVRLLVWLVSLAALMMPPVATGHAVASPQPVASVDCPGHVPPPSPCPDHGTAKHAAGDCCAAMAPMLALLPAAPGIGTEIMVRMPILERTADQAGHILTKDPPPPRA
jgi:hypothetical protein